jgi:hypothetical protein
MYSKLWNYPYEIVEFPLLEPVTFRIQSRGTDPNIAEVNILPLFQRVLHLFRAESAVKFTVIT